MAAPIAFLICSIGVAVLFYLDRDKGARTSAALWLPVIWVSIIGSRPVSVWFGMSAGSAGSLSGSLDGSPLDAAVFGALLAGGLVVLVRRGKKTSAFLAANGPIVIYFLYCLASVLWSPFHEVALKRWTKAVGDPVMMLVLATDPQPMAALKRLYSRIGFILLPLSVVLIRYTDIGRAYDPSGSPMNTGVTLNKNNLGLIVLLISLGTLWHIRSLLMHKETPDRTRHLIAQCTLFAFGMALFQMAHCATAIACFVLGAGLLLVTGLRAIRRKPSRVHALCLATALIGGITLFLGGESVVTGALGRASDLTGRTDIWKASLAAADSSLLGTGFESFWNANVGKVAAGLRGYWHIYNLVSAHNGYIEVYLDLGLIGVCLIGIILIGGYRHACNALQRDPEMGGLLLAYVCTSVFYSVTEVGFRMLTPSWTFLLLAMFMSTCISLRKSYRAARPKRAVSYDKTPVVCTPALVQSTWKVSGSHPEPQAVPQFPRIF